ncbi:uncharacterized protein LOC144138974 [Haemaphysalis longicornis]
MGLNDVIEAMEAYWLMAPPRCGRGRPAEPGGAFIRLRCLRRAGARRAARRCPLFWRENCFVIARRNEIVVLQETHNNLKLQQVHDVLLASAPFLERKPIGTKLWFCRKRTTISSCSKTCHPMARRDGFRALSLSRKDGGKVKPAQQRSAKKWTLRVKLVAVIFCSFQETVARLPEVASATSQ